MSDESVFFGSGDGYVYAVSSDKGRMKWRKRTGAGVEAVVLFRRLAARSLAR